MISPKLETLGKLVINDAEKNSTFKAELLSQSLNALTEAGFDTTGANKVDLDKFFKDNPQFFEPQLLEGTFGCVTCQIAVSVATSVLIVALIAAGVATGGGLVAAGPAVVAIIADAAATIGIGADLLTSILTASGTFSIGAITKAICEATKAC